MERDVVDVIEKVVMQSAFGQGVCVPRMNEQHAVGPYMLDVCVSFRQ